MDVVDARTRSRMMRGIRGSGTLPERQVRSALHAFGFRFARSNNKLPGRPDIVLPLWKVAVFVHGCFWHQHECKFSKLPRSNTQFWVPKLNANVDRDERVLLTLLSADWRVAVVWECATRSPATF